LLSVLSRVLDPADPPMSACENHRATERFPGEPLLWTSVKAALAAGTALGMCPHRKSHSLEAEITSNPRTEAWRSSESTLGRATVAAPRRQRSDIPRAAGQ